jgi:hypothetical protein
MNPNPIGLLAIVLSIATFALVYTMLRSRPVSVRAAVFCVTALLSIPSILFAVYYLHILPEWSWFYTLRSWRGSELLAIFPGAAAAALAALLPRRSLVLPLAGSIALTMAPYVKPIIGPLPQNLIVNHWRGNACIQSTASTCGPASVCTILKYLGSDPTERDAAHAAYSYAGGTEAWYLARYVRSKGFAPRFEFRKTYTPEVGLPAIVGVSLAGAGHFIAVLAVDADRVTYADPLFGEATVPLAQFLQKYTFTGFHMVVTQPEAGR